MIRVTREELIFDIAFAIGSHLRLLPNKREHLGVEASRALAEAIVRHLEGSRLEVYLPDGELAYAAVRT
jgi:hypothetical protein